MKALIYSLDYDCIELIDISEFTFNFHENRVEAYTTANELYASFTITFEEYNKIIDELFKNDKIDLSDKTFLYIPGDHYYSDNKEDSEDNDEPIDID